jgi:hypothetical protein
MKNIAMNIRQAMLQATDHNSHVTLIRQLAVKFVLAAR